MQIEHKKIIDGENLLIYLDVYIEDNYEFAKDNFNDRIKYKNIGKEIKKYIRNNIQYIKGAVIIVAINGILIGALTMTPQKEKNNIFNDIYKEEKQENIITSEQVQSKDENSENETESEYEKQKENTKVQIDTKSVQITANTTTTQKTTMNSATTITSTKPVTSSSNTTNNTQSSTKVDEPKVQGTYIKLNTNGVVQEIELEAYIIGVVAAEMPASFNIEALKAQAIAARTYAMKKASQGITLKNSTADQVYKTTEQLKATWGSSYSTYYNKVKNAVNSTKGLVLKYNGEYIDAQYCSMTNGKTELPEYVWSFSRPYLQCVSSNWDKKVKNFEVTNSFSYEKVSSSLGQTINKDTKIEVLSKTISDRVDKIQIGEKIYSGTKLRSLLGLRSTDFTIKLNEGNIEITTRGFGHGVGMSQYGAHMAANEGYTYRQILNHYYVGATLVSI